MEIKDLSKGYYSLNLQMFAEEDNAGGSDDADGTDKDDSTTGKGPDDNGDDTGTKTFTQDDVNRMLQDRITRERESWEKKLADQKTEAEKLANMSEAEKKKYQEQKKTSNLEEREAAITRRELTATAKEQLADKGLPISLADVLDYKDAESCKKSIDSVAKAFQEAVEKAVEERIKGTGTMKKSQGTTTETEKMQAEMLKAMRRY